MQGNDHTTDLEGALELLRLVVRERYDVKRRVVGASLKPALVSRSYGAFSELSLGYARFGDFLREAERQGVVSLHRAPNSPDFDVTPPGEPALLHVAAAQEPEHSDADEARRPTTGPTGHIRRDLWKCFVDWNQGFIRVYDSRADTARMLPNEPAPLEPNEFPKLRAALEAGEAHVTPIVPITMQQQIDWMREFADHQDVSGAQALLRFALTNERPLREFTRAARADPDLAKAWGAERTRRVAEVISKWAEDHGLELSIWSQVEPSRHSSSRKQLSGDLGGAEQELRDRLHAAIDRMPASELLRLSVPIEYLFELR